MAWYTAHEVGGPWMSRGGLLSAVGGLTGLMAAALGFPEGCVFGLILTGSLAMTILLVTATVLGVRAAREVP